MPMILALPGRLRNGQVFSAAFLGKAALALCLAALLTGAFLYF